MRPCRGPDAVPPLRLGSIVPRALRDHVFVPGHARPVAPIAPRPLAPDHGLAWPQLEQVLAAHGAVLAPAPAAPAAPAAAWRAAPRLQAMRACASQHRSERPLKSQLINLSQPDLSTMHHARCTAAREIALACWPQRCQCSDHSATPARPSSACTSSRSAAQRPALSPPSSRSATCASSPALAAGAGQRAPGRAPYSRGTDDAANLGNCSDAVHEARGPRRGSEGNARSLRLVVCVLRRAVTCREKACGSRLGVSGAAEACTRYHPPGRGAQML